VLQCPAPSHFAAAVKLAPVQLFVPHTVVESHLAQLPDPSHFPVRPQLVIVSGPQVPCDGVFPGATGVHLPRLVD
jgi:hypothetical protein